MKIVIPDFCLVLLIGSSAAATSAVARRLFAADETVASDLAGDARRAAVERRLAARALTVVDISGATAAERTELLRIAKRTFTQPVAIAVLSDVEDAEARNLATRKLVLRLERDGVRTSHVVHEHDTIELARERLAPDMRDLAGPFDIIGDVHGCVDELEILLAQLGYTIDWSEDDGERRVAVTPPPGRRLVFVGDLVDRGPRTPDALRIAMSTAAAGKGFCVPGNHDARFLRWLEGRNVEISHGLDRSIAQMGAESRPFHDAARSFLDGLPTHMWCDGGRLVVAHGGIAEAMIGRVTGAVRQFCLFGDTDNATDADGFPIRYHWAAAYRGAPTIVYGHTPIADAEWINNTLCLDTTCCFGNKLTALRWPEREIVSVPALHKYASRKRPLGHPPPRPVPTS